MTKSRFSEEQIIAVLKEWSCPGYTDSYGLTD
jgi:hypothetical protein